MEHLEEPLSFNRDFQIWRYDVGHGALLLRSCKSEKEKTRVDVLFKDVRVMELRAYLRTLSIEEVPASEVLNRPTKPDGTIEHGLIVYLVKSQDWTGCIVAGAVYWHEDDGEYGQPSALWTHWSRL